jgi:hypothetical protein
MKEECLEYETNGNSWIYIDKFLPTRSALVLKLKRTKAKERLRCSPRVELSSIYLEPGMLIELNATMKLEMM